MPAVRPRPEDRTVGELEMMIVSCVVVENVNNLSRSTFDICVRIGKTGEPFRLRSFLGRLLLALQLDPSIFQGWDCEAPIETREGARETLDRVKTRFVAGAVIRASIGYVPSRFRGSDFKPSDRILERDEIVSVQTPSGVPS